VTRRILAPLAVVVALLFGSASPALADFHVLRSTPAAASTVLEPPTAVQITFDQPVNDVAGSIQVDGSGGTYNDGVVTVTGGDTLVQPVRRMSSGHYTVTWTAGSAPGAPTTSGKFSFTVNAAAEPSAGIGQWLVIAVMGAIVAALGVALARRRIEQRKTENQVAPKRPA
jgi:methionine-rich copper-binding protein CopC